MSRTPGLVGMEWSQRWLVVVVVQLGTSVYKVLPVSVGKWDLGVMVSTSVRMLISWELVHT